MKEIHGGSRTRARGARGARSLPLATFSVFSIAALSGCFKKGPQVAPSAPIKPTSAHSEPMPVYLTPVKIQSITDSADVTGALAPLTDVPVRVKSAGKIAAIYFREGDVVRAGQIVAQQETTELQAQLDARRADLLAAQTRLTQANVVLTDAEASLKQTQNQVESAMKQAQTETDAANEQFALVKHAAEAVQRAKADLDSATVDRDRGRKDLKRYQGLAHQGALSPQQLEQAQAVADAAEARYLSSESRYDAALQSAHLSQGGSRPEEDVRKAEIRVELAKKALAAAQANRSLVPLRRADVERAEAGILAAKAEIEQAKATVRSAEQALRQTSITAPIDGIVAERKAEPGMQISLAKPELLRLVSVNSFYYDGQLREAQLSEIHIGQAVSVRVDALAGKTFPGLIAKTFPTASPAGRKFMARITLVNDSHLLRPQMYARSRILLATHSNARVVPREAVLTSNFQFSPGSSGRVFVVKDGKAAERNIKIGFSNMQSIEILSGVDVGEEVVSAGQGQLQSGDKVKVMGAASPLPSPNLILPRNRSLPRTNVRVLQAQPN